MRFDSRTGRCSSRRRHAPSLSDLVNVVRLSGTRIDLTTHFGRRFDPQPLFDLLAAKNYVTGFPILAASKRWTGALLGGSSMLARCFPGPLTLRTRCDSRRPR